MRVVDDLSGQVDLFVRKLLACLVGVVHCAIHAITEAEFASEVQRQPARLADEAARFQLFDDSAVIGRRQLTGNGVFEIESLTEDYGWHVRRNRV